MIYIIKIIFYFTIIFSFYFCAKRSLNRGKKLPFLVIIFFSLILGYYAIIVGNPVLSSDREAYYVRYLYDYSLLDASIGLDFLFTYFRKISYDSNFLWFIFQFIYIALTLTFCRYSRLVSSRALLLLFLSQYPLFGFYALKQSICNAFSIGALLIYFSCDKQSLSVMLAICFHEAGFMLIPIFIALKLWETPIFRRLGTWFIIFVVILFPLVQGFIFSGILNQAGFLASQIDRYVDGSENLSGFMTTLKGIHFYIITYVGFKYRNVVNFKIENYDKFLFLSLYCSATIMVSSVMYWYFRFSMLASLLVFIFAVRLKNELELKGYSIKWFYVVVWCLFLLSLKDLSQYYFVYGGI